MSATRICPHCGKTVASEIPDGWIKVPLETWNKLVDELNSVDHMVASQQKIDGFFRAIELARTHLAAAQAEVEEARREMA